ncbi:unnamed protein product [Cercopithifilaria johnstoni]|uniref:Jun-like transcription factor domain-containing protein n=1 Tax=Cercopithifilaria johnstoni TaxID=2874296 RepID=A0A8J2PWK3_9BILA|nr:unnamed protein product [Cercopithifilaria johnstoni]
MSTIPSAAAATTADLSTPNAASLKQLKSSMHLDFSSPTSSKKQIISADLLDIIKASPTIGKMFSQGTTTPTPTKLLYPSEVTLAQRQYAQGFIDALTQVQQLNGFVPSPALLNSPSFLAPLFQSVTASTSNNDQTKTVTSPVLTSPNRQTCDLFEYLDIFELPFHDFNNMKEETTLAYGHILRDLRKEQRCDCSSWRISFLTDVPVKWDFVENCLAIAEGRWKGKRVDAVAVAVWRNLHKNSLKCISPMFWLALLVLDDSPVATRAASAAAAALYAVPSSAHPANALFTFPFSHPYLLPAIAIVYPSSLHTDGSIREHTSYLGSNIFNYFSICMTVHLFCAALILHHSF